MKLKQVLNIYATKKDIADLCGVHKSTVSHWGSSVPFEYQAVLQEGAIKIAERDHKGDKKLIGNILRDLKVDEQSPNIAGIKLKVC